MGFYLSVLSYYLIIQLKVILAIDSAARKLFPLVFVGMQAVYWTMYLYWL